ncbi:unnamed protein product [Ambrosiozyma monospora]|uniref:Unnamed protein product n=1 Tax=Ambrosiozyma monospora TaxID=43982 RepID=A0ACB5SW68_AMBMO|nr:unnamed protein product [Ambrosiozyma monospora]
METQSDYNTGYGDETIGDDKDDWVIEIVSQFHSSDPHYVKQYESDQDFQQFVHPISTNFKLRHKTLGCYLATTGLAYPSWGFKQGEVVCMRHPGPLQWLQSATIWNIESHENTQIEKDFDYSFPKSSFMKDFIALQMSMMSSNNGLVPDRYKHDDIASSWWQWPLSLVGIRMCNWGQGYRRYYLMGNPIQVWFTTLMFVPLVAYVVYLGVGYQRQWLVLGSEQGWYLFMCGFIPLLGWLFHYLPFVIMGRVTYVHHYMPALYFAFFETAFVLEWLLSFVGKGKGKGNKKLGCVLTNGVYVALCVGILAAFYVTMPLCLGMTGPIRDWEYLRWLEGWNITN